MASGRKSASQISPLPARRSETEHEEFKSRRTSSFVVPSKIQSLPTELKLQILEHTPDVLAMKNLVVACPNFHPIFRANRYNVLFDVLRRSLDRRTDVLALIVIDILKLDGQDRKIRGKALEMWFQRGEEYCLVDRKSFLDSQPSLSDLMLFCRFHCWVLEKSEAFCRMSVKSKLFGDLWPRTNIGQELYQYIYYIEIFAAVIGERKRGWLAASFPESKWERHIFASWHEYDYARMAEIAKAIWPSRFSDGTPCRRRTRVLLQRYAKQTGRQYFWVHDPYNAY